MISEKEENVPTMWGTTKLFFKILFSWKTVIEYSKFFVLIVMGNVVLGLLLFCTWHFYVLIGVQPNPGNVFFIFLLAFVLFWFLATREWVVEKVKKLIP